MSAERSQGKIACVEGKIYVSFILHNYRPSGPHTAHLGVRTVHHLWASCSPYSGRKYENIAVYGQVSRQLSFHLLQVEMDVASGKAFCIGK